MWFLFMFVYIDDMMNLISIWAHSQLYLPFSKEKWSFKFKYKPLPSSSFLDSYTTSNETLQKYSPHVPTT